MSTNRLISTKISATRHRYAAITGMSANCTAWMNSSPMPGHWNTVSVMMVNAIKPPSCRPVIVITGTSVFFNAWPKYTARSLMPRARANLM